MKLMPTHLNLVISGLSFMMDITKSYIDCLWMHSYCKHSIFNHFNKMIPLGYSVYLSNIVARVYSKLTLKIMQQQNTNKEPIQRNKKKAVDNLIYMPEQNSWQGIQVLEQSAKMDKIIELITDFEQRLIRLYDLMIKNKVKSYIYQTEAIETVEMRIKIEKLFKEMQHLRGKTYRYDLALMYFKKNLIFSPEKHLKLLPPDHHIVINSEIVSQRSVVLLKVNLNSTMITFANSNALELFEVSSIEEFCEYQIKQFMPSGIGKAHDSYIVGLRLIQKEFLNMNPKKQIGMARVETFLISKQGTMKHIMLFVKLDYSHKDNIYLAGLISQVK